MEAVLHDFGADLDLLAAASYQDLCRQLLAAEGVGSRRWDRVGRWWNRSDEIDIVGQ